MTCRHARSLAWMPLAVWLAAAPAASAGSVSYVFGGRAGLLAHDSRVLNGGRMPASTRGYAMPAVADAGGAPSSDGSRARATVLVGAELAPGNLFRIPVKGLRHAPCGDCSYGAVEPIIRASSTIAQVDPALVAAVIDVESGFDRYALSPAGARGLMQLMPGTALRFGVSDVTDPAQNIAAGTLYLGQLLRQFSGNVRYALAAYNAGEANVRNYGGIPPFAETQDYVFRVLARYDAFRNRSAQ